MASKNPQVREIEKEASRRAAADGKSSHAERFGIRAQLREDAGLGKEERVRGGLARIYDANKQYALPLALAAAPFALPAIGSALGIGGGAAAGAGAAGAAGVAGAAGTLAPVAAPSLLGQAGGFLAKNWKPILGAAQGVTGILQQNRASNQFDDAVARDTGRWDAQQPLRDAGMERLLNPVPVDTGNLATLGARGNPFAIPPAPMPTPGPAMPPVPARRLPPVRG